MAGGRKKLLVSVLALGLLTAGRPSIAAGQHQAEQVTVSREFHDAAWDQAAGSLLIEEAGGRVTDRAGQRLDFTGGRSLRNTGMLASNGLLHRAALEVVQRAR